MMWRNQGKEHIVQRVYKRFKKCINNGQESKMAELRKVVKEDYHIQDQKHAINQQLVDIIKFRQNKKWYISISVVALFSTILALMIYFMSNGVDVQSGWNKYANNFMSIVISVDNSSHNNGCLEFDLSLIHI